MGKKLTIEEAKNIANSFFNTTAVSRYVAIKGTLRKTRNSKSLAYQRLNRYVDAVALELFNESREE